MNDHIQDVTRRFADAGYHAVAPALFHRAGGGTAPYDDFEKVLPLFEGLTDPGIVMDVEAARRATCTAPASRTAPIGIVGFCMGGRVTFLVVARARAGRGGRLLRRRHRHRALPAVPAADRPGRRAPDAVARPLRRRGRARSRSTTSSGCARSSTAPTCRRDVVRYAGAEHGFHCDVSARATTPRRPPTRGRARSPGSRSTSNLATDPAIAAGRLRAWVTCSRRSTTSSSSGSGSSTCSSSPPHPRAGGHVNLSPKGHDALRVLDDRTVAYLDLTGSGAETIAHTRENGRMTIMFCAFDGPPRILRLYGQGHAHPRRLAPLRGAHRPVRADRRGARDRRAVDRAGADLVRLLDPVHGVPRGAPDPAAVGGPQGRRRAARVLGREEHREHRRAPGPRR